MGKSRRNNNNCPSQGPRKLTPQKQHELELLLQLLLRIDIDKKASGQELWNEFQDLVKIRDQIQKIESELKVKSGTSSVERLKNVSTLCTWIKENGGSIEGVEIAEFPGYELGLRATRSLKRDEVVITIPKRLFMSLDNEVLLTEPYLTEIPFPPTMNVKLAFWLMVEKLNPNSFWRPYIDTLPEKYPNFLYYSVQEMQELKGSCALPYAINQFRKYIRVFAVMYRFLQQSKHPSLEAARQRITFDLYCWAISTVLTRENLIPVLFPKEVTFVKNFHFNDEPIRCPVLIPFWDMANHQMGEITTFYYPETDSCVCSAMDDFKAGEQMFIMYGKRANSEALIHNGFLYKNNPHHVVWIQMGLSKSDELLAERTMLLAKLDINPLAEMRLLPATSFISPELLGFIRIFNMNKEQLTHWNNSDKAVDLKHLDCALDTALEAKTWKFLEIRLAILLKAFPTTIEEDQALLSGSKPLGHIKSQLIGLRLEEKIILRDAIEYIKQREKN